MRASDSDSDQKELPPTRTTPGQLEVMKLQKLFRERQEKAMQEHMMKWHAAALAVPANDMAVRTHLHRLGEPVLVLENGRWRDGTG